MSKIPVGKRMCKCTFK